MPTPVLPPVPKPLLTPVLAEISTLVGGRRDRQVGCKRRTAAPNAWCGLLGGGAAAEQAHVAWEAGADGTLVPDAWCSSLRSGKGWATEGGHATPGPRDNVNKLSPSALLGVRSRVSSGEGTVEANRVDSLLAPRFFCPPWLAAEEEGEQRTPRGVAGRKFPSQRAHRSVNVAVRHGCLLPHRLSLETPRRSCRS